VPDPTPQNDGSPWIIAPEKFFYMNHMARQNNTGAHYHEWLEMAIVVHGKAMHRTTSGEALCKAGQVFMIPPGVWHSYTQCRQFELYNCLFSPELLGGPLAWVCQDPAMGPLMTPAPWKWGSHVLEWRLAERAIPGVRKLAAVLLKTYKRGRILRKGILVADLLRLIDYVAHEGAPATPGELLPVHSAVRRAAERLRAETARAWTLPELARELHIDPSYLVRLFRQATGSPPMKFLSQERAHKAAQLLLASDLSIGEIGTEVGWPEPKHFARCFRSHFGESATAFRLRLKNGA